MQNNTTYVSKNGYVKCSKCNKALVTNEHSYEPKYPFCPWCGVPISKEAVLLSEIRKGQKEVEQLVNENDRLRTVLQAMWTRVRAEYPHGGFPDMGIFHDELAYLGIKAKQ